VITCYIIWLGRKLTYLSENTYSNVTQVSKPDLHSLRSTSPRPARCRLSIGVVFLEDNLLEHK
jgi:hypothetical protein